jgi:hypothetical protein
MLAGTYRDLFPAIADCAAALTGLLFVAVSVAARHNPSDRPVVIQQVRAAASILAFTNALAVSLFGLVPGTTSGIRPPYWLSSASSIPPQGRDPSSPAICRGAMCRGRSD